MRGLKANSAMVKRRRRLKSARCSTRKKKVVNEKTSLEKQVESWIANCGLVYKALKLENLELKKTKHRCRDLGKMLKKERNR